MWDSALRGEVGRTTPFAGVAPPRFFKVMGVRFARALPAFAMKEQKSDESILLEM